MKNSSISLSFAPDITREGELPTRFSGIAYSGGLIPGYGWFGDVAIDLSSLQAPNKPVFALLNHDPDQRCGKCTITNAGTFIEVLGTFAQKTEAGQQVAAEFSEEAPWEFSVGINADVETFTQPTTVEVNGQTLTVNALFKNAKVREVSFVPAGADPHTQAIAFEQQPGLFSQIKLEVPVELKDVQEKLDSTTKLNADLQVKLASMQDEHSKVVADLNAKVTAFEQQAQTAMAKAAELESELTSFKHSVRINDVKALFADLHRDYTDEAAKPYCDMSDATFAAVAADLRAMKPKVNPSLFQEFAVKGTTENDKDWAKELFNQVAGAK